MTPATAESSLGNKQVTMLQAAVADFNAVLNFKSPTYAKVDKEAPLPADGGTSFYRGAGYRLTIMKSLFGMNDVSKAPLAGYMYGPVLTLGPELGIGSSNSVSRVSFYPTDTLDRLLK